jgi:UDP-N-acetyl-2-amino-2-deoxyglucuronate dehydrogenase
MCESDEFKAVDNVAILTPNHLHIPMVKKCLEKGKRVLCEKPLGISIEEVESLPNDGSVFCVLQLRKRLPKDISRPKEVDLKLNFHRDQSYWDGWKGDESKSGGILYNLGIHYIDYLIQLLGDDYRICYKMHYKDMASGFLMFGDTKVHYKMTIDKSKPIFRDIVLDGVSINLSNQENLSYEDLHKFVYEDFQKGVGVLPQDAVKAIRLVEKLKV